MKYPVLTTLTFLAFCNSLLAQLRIEGKTEVEPYKLVKLRAEGMKDTAQFRWTVSPAAAVDIERQGKKLLFVAPPGKYLISLLAIDFDEKKFEEAEATVTIGTPPPPPNVSLTVQTPNGGETWEVNRDRDIRWFSENVPGNVKIELSRDGGATWEVLFANATGDGVAPWRVTAPATTRGKVRVSSLNTPSVTDDSDGVFSISATPAPGPLTNPKVLIIYETSEASKYSTAQQSILYSKSARDYLAGKCTLEADGKTRGFAIWDKDVVGDNYFPGWKEAMEKAKKNPSFKTPWIYIYGSGGAAFEGPLPENVDKFKELLDRVIPPRLEKKAS